MQPTFAEKQLKPDHLAEWFASTNGHSKDCITTFRCVNRSQKASTISHRSEKLSSYYSGQISMPSTRILSSLPPSHVLPNLARAPRSASSSSPLRSSSRVTSSFLSPGGRRSAISETHAFHPQTRSWTESHRAPSAATSILQAPPDIAGRLSPALHPDPPLPRENKGDRAGKGTGWLL